MFATHRHCPDPSEVYRANEPAGAAVDEADIGEEEEEDLEEPEAEWADENGEVFLLLPKTTPKARNAPGADVTASKGSINQSGCIPNSRPKGAGGNNMVCLRCGKPGHLWRQCPEPLRQTLPGAGKGSPFGKKGTGKGKTGAKGRNAYLVGAEEVPTRAEETCPPIPEEQAPVTGYNESPIDLWGVR